LERERNAPGNADERLSWQPHPRPIDCPILVARNAPPILFRVTPSRATPAGIVRITEDEKYDARRLEHATDLSENANQIRDVRADGVLLPGLTLDTVVSLPVVGWARHDAIDRVVVQLPQCCQGIGLDNRPRNPVAIAEPVRQVA
jgi:hypothetical protein